MFTKESFNKYMMKKKVAKDKLESLWYEFSHFTPSSRGGPGNMPDESRQKGIADFLAKRVTRDVRSR